MRLFVWIVLIAALLGMADASLATTPEEIAAAIRRLGDERFAEREKASAALWAAGRAAEPALKEAAKSGEAEVARRARAVLDRFARSGLPDTPKEIVALIERHWAGTDPGGVLEKLCRAGRPGYEALSRIVEAETDPNRRRGVIRAMAHHVVHLAPTLLADDRADEVERLLKVGLDIPDGLDDAAAMNFAAWRVLRPTASERDAELQRHLATPRGGRAARALVCIHLAAGQTAAALNVAERAGVKQLAGQIRFQAGDWRALSRSRFGIEGIEELGFRTAFHRLASHPKEFESAVEELLRFTRDGDRNFAPFSWIPLLINERPDEAVAALREVGQHETAVRLSTLRLNYREALQPLDGLHDDAQRFRAELEVAAVLGQLGDRERAARLFAPQVRAMTEADNNARFDALVDAEFRAGFVSEALAHCAWLLEKRGEGKGEHLLLNRLMPDQGSAAAVIWKVLRRKHPDEGPDAAMRRLWALFRSGPEDPMFVALIADAARSAADGDASQPEYWMEQLAELCEHSRQDDLARRCLEKNEKTQGTAKAILRLGDFFARKKLWEEAAAAYGRAFDAAPVGRDALGRDLDMPEAVATYLRGWALCQAGQPDAGRTLQERALLLPLGRAEARADLARHLVRHGLDAEADRQFAIVIALYASHPSITAEAVQYRAYLAHKADDALRAADLWERAILGYLSMGRALRPEDYLRITHRVHALRATGLLGDGRIEDAVREVELAGRILPGDVDLPIAIVTRLGSLGRAKEADEIFTRVWDAHERVCHDYPGSAGHHNAAAWLAARCRRKLDAALTHARRAVELVPDKAIYLDTLAEVHFQRGETDRAVEFAKRCTKLEPAEPYYRDQQARYVRGDATADLPAASTRHR